MEIESKEKKKIVLNYLKEKFTVFIKDSYAWIYLPFEASPEETIATSIWKNSAE